MNKGGRPYSYGRMAATSQRAFSSLLAGLFFLFRMPLFHVCRPLPESRQRHLRSRAPPVHRRRYLPPERHLLPAGHHYFRAATRPPASAGNCPLLSAAREKRSTSKETLTEVVFYSLVQLIWRVFVFKTTAYT